MTTRFNKKVILDCDTGEDDALAILVATANKLPVKFILTSYGNTTLANSTRNTSRLLSLAGKKEIKVIKGSAKPFQKNPFEKEMTAGDFVGKNGICNAILPKSKYNNILSFNSTVWNEKVAYLLKKESPVDYIITGPCTNFAKICNTLGKSVKKYINKVYVMGGAIYADGNSGPQHPKTGKSFAEFNFYCDPIAAETVLKSKLPIYLITWDITSNITIPYDEIVNFYSKSEVGKFVIHLAKCFFKYYGFKHYRNFELNDPITIMAYLGYGKFIPKKIKITKSGREYGRTKLSKTGFEVNYFYTSVEEKRVLIKKILSDLSISR